MKDYCDDCKKVVDSPTWHIDSRGQFSSDCYKIPGPSVEKKIKSMSPEEVLSGAQYGVKAKWGKPKSRDDWTPIHKKQVEELRKAVS